MTIEDPVSPENPREERVLVLAPTANDARLTAEFLAREGMTVEICRDIAEVCARVEEGCGSLLLAEETLAGEAARPLVDALARQPAWSDVPIAIITSGGEVSQTRLLRLGVFGRANVTLLERPFRPATLVSTVEVARRARRRQYEVRKLLEKLRAGEERLQRILGSINDAFVAIDREWRFTYLNPSYMELVSPLYQSPEGLVGQNLWEKFPDIVDTEVGRFYRRMMDADAPATLELFYPPLEVWLEVRAFPSATGLSLYIQNINGRRQHEAEVAELSRKIQDQARIFDTTLSNITDFAYTFDREGRFIYANRPLLDLWGLTIEESVGKNFFDLPYPDELAARLQSQIAEVFETGRTVRDETAYTSPTGETGFYEYIFSPVFGADGAVEIVAGSTRVTTERKRREAEVTLLQRKLEAQARLFDATLSNIEDLVYSFDRQGQVVYANKALLEIWGKTLPEVVGKNVFDLGYPAELAEKVHDQLLEVIATGRPIRGETVFRSASGREDIHDYIYNPIFGEAGEVTAVVGTTRLVTEHRRAEGAMRRLAAIVQFSDDAIISKSLDGVITSWNAGAQRLFGYAAEEIVGRNVLLLIPPERHDEEPGIVGRICRGEPVEHYETVRVRKNGTRVTVSLTVSPIKDAEGNVVGASKIARDITEQKQIERALKEAKEAAEAANRSKDHFLAVLSHELRTPLTPVLMTASALEMDPVVPARLRADMAMIRRNVELETKLIDDLLDLSRITMGKLALHMRAVDVNEAVRQVGAICEPEAGEKGVRLELDLDEKAGTVRADPARLQQVLWNLLKNAVKFTPAGGTICVRTRSGDEGRVLIAVQDSGIGIPAEVLPKVFDAFEQGDPRMTRQFGGLGLGLAITNALVGLHEGTISAASAGPGQGSTFTVDLPVSADLATVDGSDPMERRETGSLRILIVEDHADTATMLAKLLGGMGYDVAIANTAAAGLEIAEKRTFDVVVSDLGLPDMTGYEFMQRLRETREIKGIAMSGYGMEDDIRRSLECGFSEHLVKPVNLSSLEQAIRRIANR